MSRWEVGWNRSRGFIFWEIGESIKQRGHINDRCPLTGRAAYTYIHRVESPASMHPVCGTRSKTHHPCGQCKRNSSFCGPEPTLSHAESNNIHRKKMRAPLLGRYRVKVQVHRLLAAPNGRWAVRMGLPQPEKNTPTALPLNLWPLVHCVRRPWGHPCSDAR